MGLFFVGTQSGQASTPRFLWRLLLGVCRAALSCFFFLAPNWGNVDMPCGTMGLLTFAYVCLSELSECLLSRSCVVSFPVFCFICFRFIYTVCTLHLTNPAQVVLLLGAPCVAHVAHLECHPCRIPAGSLSPFLNISLHFPIELQTVCPFSDGDFHFHIKELWFGAGCNDGPEKSCWA